MGYKAAAQVLKKADPLKAKLSGRHQDLLGDLQAWSNQQQLQTIYHQVLVLDLEYALDKKVEQDLWSLGFKNHISTLQEQTRDKKNPRRTESQGLLSWCLEAASGFYLSLLQELCSTYDLDLSFRRCGAVFGKLRSYTESTSSVPQSSSCLYICQYCLVHLGDIARYRNQRQQAESFYKHAILVSPNSGHPYNQLALLEASQGDKLATVFQYVRSIAVKNPFPAAVANLAKTLSAAIEKDEPVMEVQTKMSVSEYIALFLRMHGLLHTQTDLRQAQLCLKSINATLTALVATQSFTREQLIMMSVVNMYALHHLGDGVLTQDERSTWRMVLALLAGSLSAFLLPVYTLKNDATILDYYALPAIRLLLMWIKNKAELLKEVEFSSRLQIWPGYCKLLNNISEHVDDKHTEDASTTPLSYDKELQGFTPLQPALSHLNFKTTHSADDANAEKHVQAMHLLELGTWLTNFDLNGSKLVILNHQQGDTKNIFEPGCIQPDPTDKLLEEMKSFTIAATPFDATKLKTVERKAGILKPQGSLEKARDERKLTFQSCHVNEQEDGGGVCLPKLENNVKLKRVTQNVALQSIYKKLEENKQVKFTDSHPKQQQQQQQQQVTNRMFNAQFRPQSHQTNHLMKDEFFYVPPPPPQIPMPPQSTTTIDNMNMHYQQQQQNKNMFNHSQQGMYPPLMQQQQQQQFNHDERNWWPRDNPLHAQNQHHMNYMPQQQQQQQQYKQDYYNMYNHMNSTHGAHEMYSPWGNRPANPPPPPQNMHLNMSQSSLSMRQAMLNESISRASTSNSAAAPPPQQPQSYSLFNSGSTWAPVPQLRTAAPQSLQQLLEQQAVHKGADCT